MPQPAVYITGLGLAGPTGTSLEGYLAAHYERATYLRPSTLGGQEYATAPLAASAQLAMQTLVAQNKKYARLDPSVQMALLASHQLSQHNPDPLPANTGVCIGSSRGATATWEAFHQAYFQTPERPLGVYASPSTTAGNLASWVQQALGIFGPAFAQSITCGTGLYALGNALAWLRAGMADAFVAGATEAPLTGFTLAQFRSLRVYTEETNAPYPCRPFGTQPPGMALGEGAVLFRLATGAPNHPPSSALARIVGFGTGSEAIPHAAGITQAGDNLATAMANALQNAGVPACEVPLVLCHAPGTASGDRAELAAVQRVFGVDMPSLYANKWLMGHTFGAAPAFSVALGVLLLGKTVLPTLPYPNLLPAPQPLAQPLRYVLVNGVGFGGVAASILLEKVAQPATPTP